MSKNEWERGTITIPSAQWASFRKDLLAKWNARELETLELAKKAHKAAVKAGKGKRADNRQKAMKAAIAKVCGGTINKHGYFHATTTSGYGYDRREYNDDVADANFEAVTGLLYKWDHTGRVSKATLRSPQKKLLELRPLSKSGWVNLGEATITFNNATRTVEWDVSENNHAVERAREHWFAGEFFSALGGITWTRGSGGELRGNDEYNEDDEGYGRRAAYVTATYRMKTAAEKRAASNYSNRSYGRYSRPW